MSSLLFPPEFLTDDERFNERVTQIVELFYGWASEMARSRIGPAFRSRMSGSSIANSALHGFFRSRSMCDLATLTTQDFTFMLRSIVLHKLSDRLRRHSASKRSVSSEADLSDADPCSCEPDAYDLAVAKELYQFVVQKLRDMHGEGSRFRTAEFGILLKMSGSEIKRRLEEEFPDEKNSGTRAILLRLVNDRKELQEHLLENWIPDTGSGDRPSGGESDV